MKQDHYKNVGVVVLVLLLLAAFFQFKKGYDTKYFVIAVFCFAALMYTFEPLAKHFSTYWMKFGKLLGDVNSRIILSVFFILFLLPMALLKRVFTKTAKRQGSTWLVIEDEQHNFKNPW